MIDAFAPQRPGRPAALDCRRSRARRSMLPIALAAVLAIAVVLLLAPGTAAAFPTHTAVTTLGPTATSGQAVADVNAGGTVFQFGRDAVVSKTEHVTNVVAVGGNVIVRGTANVAVAVGGDVRVTGTVHKTCVTVGGNIRLGPTATVGDSLGKKGDSAVVLVGGHLYRKAGSQISGDIASFQGHWVGNALRSTLWDPFITPFHLGSIVAWIIWTGVAIVLAIIAVAVAPRQVNAVTRAIRRRPLPSLGWGALSAFVMIPICLVILTITVIGLLIVVPWLLLTPFLLMFSYLCLGIAIGEAVLRSSQSRTSLYLTATIGVLIVSVVRLIPVIGFIAVAFGVLIGFGALVLAVADWQRRRRELRRAALAGAVPPGPGGLTPPAGPAGPVPPGAPMPPAGSVPPGAPSSGAGWSPSGSPGGAAGSGGAQASWAPPAQGQWSSGPGVSAPGQWYSGSAAPGQAPAWATPAGISGQPQTPSAGQTQAAPAGQTQATQAGATQAGAGQATQERATRTSSPMPGFAVPPMTAASGQPPLTAATGQQSGIASSPPAPPVWPSLEQGPGSDTTPSPASADQTLVAPPDANETQVTSSNRSPAAAAAAPAIEPQAAPQSAEPAGAAEQMQTGEAPRANADAAETAESSRAEAAARPAEAPPAPPAPAAPRPPAHE